MRLVSPRDDLCGLEKKNSIVTEDGRELLGGKREREPAPRLP